MTNISGNCLTYSKSPTQTTLLLELLRALASLCKQELYERILYMSIKDERLILLGQKIKQLRKSKKVSQLNLSIKLDITREHLSKLERGVAYPSVKILFSILDALNLDINNIFNIKP